MVQRGLGLGLGQGQGQDQGETKPALVGNSEGFTSETRRALSVSGVQQRARMRASEHFLEVDVLRKTNYVERYRDT